MIAKMGAYPSYQEPSTRFSTSFTKFRTAVRVVIATKRMQFLVAKSKKSIRQVIAAPADSKLTSHRDAESNTKSAKVDPAYRPRYRPGSSYQNVPSRFPTTEGDSVQSGFSSRQEDISIEQKDSSFAEILTGNLGATAPQHTDSGVYSAFDHHPRDSVTLGTSTSHRFHDQANAPNSYLANRFESRNVHRSVIFHISNKQFPTDKSSGMFILPQVMS